MTTKRKAGRPKIGERYLVVLDDASVAKAEAIGGGRNKRSAGIRIALSAYKLRRRPS